MDMQEVTELERRITAALERIGRGLDAMPDRADHAMPVAISAATPADGGPVDADEVLRLSDALDEERMLTAQLNERIRVIRDQEARAREALAEEMASVTKALSGALEDNARLREQLEQAAAEAAALRLARSAEAAELGQLISALEPVLAQGGH